MNISITFRHIDATEAIKAYATDKIAKLQKFLRQPMTAKVTLSLDKLQHCAETRISSGGAHIEAKEVSADLYASIDGMIDKLERQIRGSKGAAEAKKRRQTLRDADRRSKAVASLGGPAMTPAGKSATAKPAAKTRAGGRSRAARSR